MTVIAVLWRTIPPSRSRPGVEDRRIASRQAAKIAKEFANGEQQDSPWLLGLLGTGSL